MANNIEVVQVELTEAMQRAARKLALRNDKYSASEHATRLLSQTLKARFKQVMDNAADDLKRSYDAAVRSGFTIAESRDEFVKRQMGEMREIYAEL